MFSIGVEALISILSHVFFVMIVWHVLQAVRIEHIFKKNKTFEIKLALVMLTIVLASIVSRFFLDLLFWSQQLIYLF